MEGDEVERFSQNVYSRVDQGTKVIKTLQE